MAPAVAKNVNGVVTTASLRPTSRARNASRMASVPFAQPIACFECDSSATCFSRRSTGSPSMKVCPSTMGMIAARTSSRIVPCWALRSRRGTAMMFGGCGPVQPGGWTDDDTAWKDRRSERPKSINFRYGRQACAPATLAARKDGSVHRSYYHPRRHFHCHRGDRGNRLSHGASLWQAGREGDGQPAPVAPVSGGCRGADGADREGRRGNGARSGTDGGGPAFHDQAAGGARAAQAAGE